jgi:hypothetical protein
VSTLLIAYDLRRRESPGDYERLFESIRRHPHCHVQDSVWLVRSEQTPALLRDELWSEMDADDRLLVIDVSGDVMAWLGLDPEVAEWIVNNNPATT